MIDRRLIDSFIDFIISLLILPILIFKISFKDREKDDKGRLKLEEGRLKLEDIYILTIISNIVESTYSKIIFLLIYLLYITVGSNILRMNIGKDSNENYFILMSIIKMYSNILWPASIILIGIIINIFIYCILKYSEEYLNKNLIIYRILFLMFFMFFILTMRIFRFTGTDLLTIFNNSFINSAIVMVTIVCIVTFLFTATIIGIRLDYIGNKNTGMFFSFLILFSIINSICNYYDLNNFLLIGYLILLFSVVVYEIRKRFMKNNN